MRGRQKALVEFERASREATEDKPGLRIAIAHADAPEWVGILSELVWRVRPKAEIEFTATLGAVVSTHAGPGHRRLLLAPGRPEPRWSRARSDL